MPLTKTGPVVGGLRDTTAVVLVGGLGTRLRSVVADRPKVVAEVNGRPFLAFLLDQLEGAGVRSAVLCTGYMGERVREMFGEAHGGLRLTYSLEPEPLGTAGALRWALSSLESDEVLVMNGDSICQVDLAKFASWHRAKGAEVSLVLTEVADTDRFGSVCIDEGGRVLSFEEKGGRCQAGWINAGIYLVTREWIGSIPSARAISLEREVFPRWIGRGFYGYRETGRFLDIGTPEEYTVAGDWLADLACHDSGGNMKHNVDPGQVAAAPGRLAKEGSSGPGKEDYGK